jgi:hypothetical protein
MKETLFDNFGSVWQTTGDNGRSDAPRRPSGEMGLQPVCGGSVGRPSDLLVGSGLMKNRGLQSTTVTADMLMRVSEAHQEHHVVLWSADAARRAEASAVLAEHLRSLPEVELFHFDGSSIRSLKDFCTQLTAIRAAIPASEGDAGVKASIDGPGGVIDSLRERQGELSIGVSGAKRRYYLWTEADTLLNNDPAAFGGVIDAMAGVAAEAEYASEDLLLIHRAILIGGPALATYAGNEHGQFRSWLPDAAGSPPLWKVISGLEQPPVFVLEL